jgi:quercetin dioxygenase-like cupin family protein
MTQSTKTKMYNWNTLPREVVRKGVERVGFRGENAMVVMNFATPGMDLRPHQHDFEQVAICVQGRMNYYVGDEKFEMVPGSMLRIPPHTMHYAEPLGDEVVYNLDLFSPIREDYKHLVAYQAEEFAATDAENANKTAV